MVLAAFIVILATYDLSPRNDLRNKQQVPMAEAAVAKFLVQHDAAVEYAKYHLALNLSDPDSYSGISAGMLTGCNASNEGNLCNHLPIGFNYEENLYYSTIYCLNSAEYTKTENPDTGEENIVLTAQEGTKTVADCNAIGINAIYVISYGRIPQRWKNVSTNRVLADYYTAMHSKIAAGSSCGIVVPKAVDDDKSNPLDSEYIIEGIEVQNASIPKYFLDNDTKFREKCTLDRDGEFPCIIYVTEL